jgi:dTDP-4-dehydrorhamnose reductase
MDKVLILGHTGKMGTALMKVLAEDFEVVGKNSKDFDANNFSQTRDLIQSVRPYCVINTIAFMGIDESWYNPRQAYKTNVLMPRFLAEYCRKWAVRLCHFSTDNVFGNHDTPRFEFDTPDPITVYGRTKYAGDRGVMAANPDTSIFRVPLLFGPTSSKNQFVEKMLSKEREIFVANDIQCSIAYSMDVAKQIKELIVAGLPSGVYHITNNWEAGDSLYDLMKAIVVARKLNINVQPTTRNKFPAKDKKNHKCFLASVRLEPMRPWRDAVQECYGQ